MDWSFLISNKDSLSVSTDTRNLPAGCVFFALVGESFDGNRFAGQALESGASIAILSNEEVYKSLLQQYPKERLVLLDEEGRRRGGVTGLQGLARAWRKKLVRPIFGITGTNGKTTTKELTAAVLSTKYKIHYTQGNLNNSIGVPLTVLQISRQHELAIVEMGASHPGDIQELVEVAEPNYGLITNVGRAHLQGFGSFEGVQRTKQELYDYLVAHDGTVFRNADNPYLAAMYADALSKAPNSHSQLIEYHTGTMPAGTHLVGDYNAENVSAALAVGEAFGIPREQGLAAIRAYIPSNNRSQLVHSERNNTIVVDAYNANPTSMQAAINAFKGDTYILGGMRELGEYSHLEHQNIVNMLAERKAERVLLVGDEYAETTAPYPILHDVTELIAYLQQHPLHDGTVLLKGSRGNQLEKALPYL